MFVRSRAFAVAAAALGVYIYYLCVVASVRQITVLINFSQSHETARAIKQREREEAAAIAN
jgi:hypothetical protein